MTRRRHYVDTALPETNIDRQTGDGKRTDRDTRPRWCDHLPHGTVSSWTPDMRLRWSTWNLWAIGQAWVERTGLAAQVLEPLDLDVICLQEVRRQADRDAGKALADDLGMHLGLVGSRSPLTGGVGVSERRSPSTTWCCHDGRSPTPASRYSRPSRIPPSDAAHSTSVSTLPDRSDWSRHSSARRRSRRRSGSTRSAPLAAELADRRRPDDVVLVAGDMNAEPDSDEMRLLCGHKTAPPIAVTS